MPDQTPITKQDLDAALTRQRDELIEAMRDMQTEMLRAFHNWASPLEIRIRHLPEIEQRLAWAEDRISALERGEGPPMPKPE